MNRTDLVKKGFWRVEKLNLKNREYAKWVRIFTSDVLRQDLGSRGDVTTQSLFGRKTRPFRSVIRSGGEGLIAGIEEAMWFYGKHGIRARPRKKDGESVKKGEAIIELSGPGKLLMETERTGLKILQRMSGIATATRRLVEKTRKEKVFIAATRKTHWQLLDKKAVCLGGGLAHRLGLSESIMIKDNHLERLKESGHRKDYIEEALKRAWKDKGKSLFIEIEVESRGEALRAAREFRRLQSKPGTFPCVIMLDNMAPRGIKETVRELKAKDLYRYVLLEASGRINDDNIGEYAKTGVDIISIGSITHSPDILDMDQAII